MNVISRSNFAAIETTGFVIALPCPSTLVRVRSYLQPDIQTLAPTDSFSNWQRFFRNSESRRWQSICKEGDEDHRFGLPEAPRIPPKVEGDFQISDESDFQAFKYVKNRHEVIYEQ